MAERSLDVDVYYEYGVKAGLRAQVREWPGCFASGKDLNELLEAIDEALSLYITPQHEHPPVLRTRVISLALHAEADRPLEPAREEAFAGPLAPPLNRDPHMRWEHRPFDRR